MARSSPQDLNALDWVNLVKKNSRCFAAPREPDLTLNCGRYTWLVHQSVLCRATNSLIYANATARNDIFGCLSPVAVHAMLEFLYTGSYDDTAKDPLNTHNDHDKGPIWMNVQVYEAARRLNIPSLALLSVLKFTQRARPLILTQEFAATVKEIYTILPHLNSSLQESVISLCKEYGKQILWRGAMSFSHIRKVSEEVPLFASQLARASKTGQERDRKKRKRREAMAEASLPADDPPSEVDETGCSGELLSNCDQCGRAVEVQSVAELDAVRFCPYCGTAKKRKIKQEEDLEACS